ncbi:MAG TPA: matrixin family metalloprotease [Polyangiaceae bacterium]|nr:matrixin family metalloprotease [Polyangiaceae bacterium]
MIKRQNEPNEAVKQRKGACRLPPVANRPLPPVIDPRRARLIRETEKKWVNGTELRYHFLAQPTAAAGPAPQREAVRIAFSTWKELGIGLNFKEVAQASEAEIRIAFDANDGSWSYIGRDAIDLVGDPSKPTMNFGWDLTTTYGRDTALHEIGHALGFPHEHQNPNSGIVWDEAAVYAYFAGHPNYWDRETTYYNIIRKLEPREVEGSAWDRDSVMHYHFEAGLISEPEALRGKPLIPKGSLSPTDIEEVRRFYPTLDPQLPELKVWELQRVQLPPGGQLDWVIRPSETREYTLQTFGALDTVMVLFEVTNDGPRYMAADDDSGTSLNAELKVRLLPGREYILRLRLYYSDASGGGALMMY